MRAGGRGAGRLEGSGIDWDAHLKRVRGCLDAGWDVRGDPWWWRAQAAAAGGALPRMARTPIATPNAKTRNDFIPTLLVAREADPAPPIARSHIPPGPGVVPPTASRAVTTPIALWGSRGKRLCKMAAGRQAPTRGAIR